MTTTAYTGWALVEVMGHRTLIGEISEAEQYGTAMLRIDTPGPDDQTVTQFYGGSSIFSITPMTEASAREQLAARRRWHTAPHELGAGDPDDDVDEPDDALVDRYDGWQHD